MLPRSASSTWNVMATVETACAFAGLRSCIRVTVPEKMMPAARTSRDNPDEFPGLMERGGFIRAGSRTGGLGGKARGSR
jgi:hypothetical protein